MKSDKKIIEINNNFHFLYKKECVEKKNVRYQKYRKKWKRNPEKFVADSFPMHLDIESTNVCNLRCPFCSFGAIQGQNPGMMDWNLYKRIVDEGQEHNLSSIKLSIRGEPLLHPRIIEMIDYAKQKGIIDIYFNTNGALLKEKIAEELIDVGLNRISISFEGTTKEVFEKNRVGAKYEEVIKNIENLIACRDKKKVTNPRVRIQSVLIPEMENNLDEYKDFWKEKRVDEIAYLDLEKEPQKDEKLSCPWVCPQLWQRMSILYDGMILPCVHDTYALMQLGNVRDLNISEAWENELEVAYRNLHKNGHGELLYSCTICPLRAGQVRKIKES